MTLFECQNISFSYGDHVIFKDFNMSIEEGRITSIVGPNGAGKTTFLKLLQGLIKPQSGQVLFRNQNILQIKPKQRAKLISSVPQVPELIPPYSLIDFVQLGRYPFLGLWQKLSAQDHNLIAKTLEILNLSHLSQQALHTLSGGEQQRAWLAQALVQEPSVLLLDEPFASLDTKHQDLCTDLFEQWNQDLGMSIICITHDQNWATKRGQVLTFIL